MNYQTGTGTNLGFEIENENNPFGQILADYELNHKNTTNIKVGNHIKGKLIQKNNRYALLDFNGKSNIYIQLNSNELPLFNNININDDVTVVITNIDDKSNFTINGSLYQLKLIELDSFLKNAYDNCTVLTGIPVDANHAGYDILVNINEQELILFMPHLLTDVNKLPDVNSILHTEIEFILDKIKKGNSTIYLASRKAFLEKNIYKEKDKLVKGQKCNGYVTGCTDFAVFVQFNDCLTGMIHKSNLTDQAVALLPNIPAGTTIEFFIKDIGKDKLFLTQVLRDSLWDSIAIGDELSGTISGIKDFGLMIQLDYETKGLLHKSVLKKLPNEYKKGDNINVKVTNVNKNNRQITLILQ